jgi:hypothetical protein
MVGGGPDVGKGTKVCKPLEAGRSRRKYAGGKRVFIFNGWLEEG